MHRQTILSQRYLNTKNLTL